MIQNSFTQFYVSQFYVALTRVRNRRSVISLFMTRSANEKDYVDDKFKKNIF